MTRATQLLGRYSILEKGEVAGKMELVKTPVGEARAYAEKVMKAVGRKLDIEIPNFDKNYEVAKKAASGGRTKRKDMPVIDIEDIKGFQRALEKGMIDFRPPYTSKGNSKKPFPSGLSGNKARDWLRDGLQDGDKKDDIATVSSLSAKARLFHPIQQQIYFDKSIEATAQFGAKGTRDFIENKSLMIASEDLFIIDGHHRWLSALLIDPDMLLKGLQIDLPIKQLLPLSLSYGDAIGNKRNS